MVDDESPRSLATASVQGPSVGAALALEASRAHHEASLRSMADILGRRQRDDHASPSRPESAAAAHGMADRLKAGAVLARRLAAGGEPISLASSAARAQAEPTRTPERVGSVDAPTLAPEVTYSNGETVNKDWEHEYPFNDTTKSAAEPAGRGVARMCIFVVIGLCGL